MIDQSIQLPDAIRNAKNLPSLPSVALEVLQLSRDPDAGTNELTKAVSTDPALSTRIVKLANSPNFRRGREITSLNQATALLGMKPMKLLALGFSLAGSLPRKGESTTFDFEHYWRRSLATAVAAGGLARLTKAECGDEAFLCGLLSRVGQLIMATTVGEQYQAVLDASPSALPSMITEREVLGYDFHQVGESLLQSWELPELLSGSVGGWECDVTTTNAAIEPMCRLLQIADAISVLIYEEGKGIALTKVHELGVIHFGLSEDEVDNFFVTLQDQISETTSSLHFDNVPGAAEYGRLVQDARDQLLQISLAAVQDLEDAEGYAKTLTAANKVLDVAANTDKLTQLPNRASFDHTIDKVIEARLQGELSNALGILFLDIDDFKSFNDIHGHLVGDAVLKMVASRLKGATRDSDFIARYGGEEFVAILPNTTLSDLESIAERLRQVIDNQIMEHEGKQLHVTISLGGACVNKVSSIEDGQAILALADECLYQAKEAGRNRWKCRDIQPAPA